jgi:glycosyltransferase involved in cell wall biosynthesis
MTGGIVDSFASAEESLLQRLHGARKGIARALRLWQPEIVASHFAMYTAPALDLLQGRRNVTHFHGPWGSESLEEGKGRAAAVVKRRLEAAVYRRADRVIVLSEAFGRLVTETFGVAEERVRLVPGAVDTARFALTGPREDSRRALGLPLHRPVLVTVRRLVHRMGLATLLEAMPAIVRAVPEVLLCLAGSGPLRGALEAQVEALGLRENVRFLGFVTEAMLPHLYYAADVNLVPTTALEGFGLVAAEAMATGTPSMVTPVGGLPEVVGGLSKDLIFASTGAGEIAEGVIGALRGDVRLPEVVGGLSKDLIFASTGAAEIAEGVIGALRGDVRLPERAACREYVERNFRSALMAERTATVYRELMDEEPSAR